MYDFHTDKARYFDWQYQVTRDYVLPFVTDFLPPARSWRVLEIGCGEAGVLKAFLEKGHTGVGIDLDASRIELAKKFQAEAVAEGKLTFFHRDIYDIDVAADLGEPFDLVVLKDVIEHIPNQGLFLNRLKDFIHDEGLVFFGFPPWQMPFGGHQQICRNKYLARLPYFHLLPRAGYRAILEGMEEPKEVVEELMELKETGLSIELFERYLRQTRWKVLRQELWLINPIYEHKFKLQPRRQFPGLSSARGLRNLVTTCAYYLVGK